MNMKVSREKENAEKKDSAVKVHRKSSLEKAKEIVARDGLLPVKNDYVFSHLFGSKKHKELLICLLNSILNGKPRVKDLTLAPTEYKKTEPDGKTVRLDVAAVSEDGTILHIEIQTQDEGNIGDRASFYQSVLREGELKEGEDYSSIPDIISIWIVAEPVTNRKACYHEIVSMYKANGVDPIQVASEKMRQLIIELPKLEANPKRFINRMFEAWVKFIRDPENIPPELLEIPEVKKAMDALTYMSANPDVRAAYQARVREMNRIRAGQAIKYKEGLAEGEKRERVRAERREKQLVEKAKAEKIESAKNLLKAGISVEIVADSLGLSIEEIQKL